MSEHHENQSLIVAIDRHLGCYLLSGVGDAVSRLIEDYGSCDLIDFGFDEDDHPREAGIHVWEGSLTRHFGGDEAEEFSWSGDWRAATLEDFDRFGLAVPKAGGQS